MRTRAATFIAMLLLAVVALPVGGAQAEERIELDLPKALEASLSNEGIVSPRWLSASQCPDGHWSAMEWDRWWQRLPWIGQMRLLGRATKPHDVATTGLALLAYLGAGYTHRGSHPHARVVADGLQWLIRRQAPAGSFTAATDPDPQVAHAIATLALTEVYGMTAGVRYREPAVRALKLILATQSKSGAWQHPGSDVDNGLGTFWAAMSLKSAELINKDAVRRGEKAPLPTEVSRALQRIVRWLDTQTDPATGIVRPASDAERARGATSLVLTAAGALVRIFAGADPRRSKILRAAADHLVTHMPTRDAKAHQNSTLYAYIGTLALFQVGGKHWGMWKRRALEENIVETQDRGPVSSRRRGSWAPRGAWTKERGAVASTALNSMSLEVFYRYDRVFGDKDRAGVGPLVELRRQALTWEASVLPGHAARMTLAEGGSLPIEAVHMRAEVHGVRAQVVLDLFVTNPKATQFEGMLDVRLPDGAAPYYLAFGEAVLERVPDPGTEGTRATDLASLRAQDHGDWGRVLEARMAPVEAATEAFETIVRKRKDPALLTWSGAGVYKLRVFPLLPKKQHRIVVAYEVDLAPVGEDAGLVLPLPTDVPDVRVAVRARGVTWTAAPVVPLEGDVRTWHRPAGDAIRVRVTRPGDVWLMGDDTAGRTHTAAWIEPAVPVVPREAYPSAHFLIDTSPSVTPEQMGVWRELVPAILEANRDQITSFHATFFDMQIRRWRTSPTRNTPENVASLMEAMRALEPGGATDLTAALASVHDVAPRTSVFLFTDGQPTWGDTDHGAVLRQVSSDRPVFAYLTGLGREDAERLRDLTGRSGGALITVLGRADVPAAARAHRSCAWSIESLALPGVSDILLAGEQTSLHAGQRLRLAGRGRPTAGAALAISLRCGRQRQDLLLPVRQPVRSSMAARAYGRIGMEQLDAVSSRFRDLSRDYAMHYRVVGPRTALVMLESEQDYRRFKLTGGGHAGRVEKNPVRATLAAARELPHGYAVPEDEDAGSAAAFAKERELSAELVRVLRLAPARALRPPPRRAVPSDPVLRALAGALDLEAPGAAGRLALQAYALGLDGHAYYLLWRTSRPGTDRPTADWIMARVAERARRPLLAILAFETALGSSEAGYLGQAIWVIAADYDRFLRAFLATGVSNRAARFARARLATLAHWRKLLAGHALPRRAALLVLHVPFDARDGTAVEVRGPHGIVEQGLPSTSRSRRLHVAPLNPGGPGPRMHALDRLGTGDWTVRLVRPSADAVSKFVARSLVIVIQAWGTPALRVALIRSVAPEEYFGLVIQGR